ncbi:DNA-processing protein DprA [Butyrivibrio sp. VCB2006]|uniref:DNA-processing protein DprA n=1 Tax=Butyrivibrio sp. VCB2006 TaxID=1280679 RepID=UPI0004104548|nr:DNA-processing protein DprA [Butyrivibrio sp. VCB2006]
MTDINNITENEYAHWLFSIPGLGNRSIDKLLCNGMTCREIYEANSKEFKGILTEKQIKSLEQYRRCWDFEKEAAKLAKKNISFISRIDERFPEKLKNIPDPPFALYVKGQLPDPEKPSVAIIGARMCSEYGRYMARSFGRGLALAGVQVISGMARGVDGISQKAALAAGGRSFGIVGSGVDVCYPEENLDVYNDLCACGGVISEFPPGTFPKAAFFPMRNRIISGLADVVLVIEAREKSGTQITVDTALEQGREVLAVPGRVTDRLSDGCNLLISQGAGVAIGVEDVLERIWDVKKQKTADKAVNKADCLSECDKQGREEEKSMDERILECIDIIPISSSQIMEQLQRDEIDISFPQLLGKLMDFIHQGFVIQEGSYFRKKC